MNDRVVIDTNAFIVLILGMIDTRLFKDHKRTSAYEDTDFENLISLVPDLSKVLVLPNIMTEVDNLLNDFRGHYKYPYIQAFTTVIKATTEIYLKTESILAGYYFAELGLTDSLILEVAKDCKFLITADSKLSDYAKSLSIEVFDLVEYRNLR